MNPVENIGIKLRGPSPDLWALQIMYRLETGGSSYVHTKKMPPGKISAQVQKCIECKLHTPNTSPCCPLFYIVSRLGVDYISGVPVTAPPKGLPSAFSGIESCRYRSIWNGSGTSQCHQIYREISAG